MIEPTVKKNLPALRVEPFITLFERHVTKVQEEINRLREIERPYNVIKSVLLDPPISNDSLAIEMYPTYVEVTFTANDTTTRADFWAMFKAMRDALKKSDLLSQYGTGTYPDWKSSMCPTSYFSIKLGQDRYINVYLQMVVPSKGTKHIAVNTSYVQRTYTADVIAMTYSDDLETPEWDKEAA